MQFLNEFSIIGIFFFILAISFTILTYLVLNKGKSEINYVFSFATITFALGSLFCAIDFWSRGELIPKFSFISSIGLLGTVLYIWAPFGIFLSGKMILDGVRAYKDPISILLAIYLGLITVIFFISIGEPILQGLKPSRGTWFGVIVISSVLLVAIYYYAIIYQKVEDLRSNLSFLIFGMLLGIFGLISSLLSSGDVNILPMEINPVFLVMINLGILIASFAFTNIPQSLRTKAEGLLAKS